MRKIQRHMSMVIDLINTKECGEYVPETDINWLLSNLRLKGLSYEIGISDFGFIEYLSLDLYNNRGSTDLNRLKTSKVYKQKNREYLQDKTLGIDGKYRLK